MLNLYTVYVGDGFSNKMSRDRIVDHASTVLFMRSIKQLRRVLESKNPVGLLRIYETTSRGKRCNLSGLFVVALHLRALAPCRNPKGCALSHPIFVDGEA